MGSAVSIAKADVKRDNSRTASTRKRNNAPTTRTTKQRAIPLRNYLTNEVFYDTLHQAADRPMACSDNVCRGSQIDQNLIAPRDIDQNTVMTKAELYLKSFYNDHKRSEEFPSRWRTVRENIQNFGTYDLTTEELKYGCCLAWRNEPRCPARIQWQNLECFDKRDVTNTTEMYEAIIDHIKYSYNGGTIRPAITVFRKREIGKPDLRVWNPLMAHFAGYKLNSNHYQNVELPESSSLNEIGDQGNLEFTEFCQELGWKGDYENFDYLPLVLSVDDETPIFFDFPKDILPTVKIQHPSIEAIASLGLEWYPLPGVSWLLTEIGGLQFPATPFTGWYSSIEILRDFLEENRYPGILEKIADAMELDRSINTTLWKDRVALELNIAVLHSFAKAGVTIVDQHSSLEQYMIHMKNEMKERGGCPSDWVWINPSQSGSLCPVYHQETLHYHLSPCFQRQNALWKTYRFAHHIVRKKRPFKIIALLVKISIGLYNDVLMKRPVVKIFYATETGTAKYYAEKLLKLFEKTFNAALLDIIRYDSNEDKETDNNSDSNLIRNKLTGLCFFITSTFGNGEPPRMAAGLAQELDELLNRKEDEVYHRLRTKDFIFDNDRVENKIKLGLADEKSNASGTEGQEIKQFFDRNESRKSTLRSRINIASTKPERRVSTNFDELSYGIFALGNSSYPSFCGFGTWLDNAFTELSGQRLLKIGYGDELGDRDAAFEKWANLAYKQACLECSIDITFDRINHIEDMQEIAAKWIEETKTSTESCTLSELDVIRDELSKQCGNKVEISTISRRQWLSKKDQKNILISLVIKDGRMRNLSYDPGDHVVVFPTNSDEDVDIVLEHMTNLPKNPLSRVKLMEKGRNTGWVTSIGNKPSSTLRRLLKYHLDIRSTPTKSMLDFLSKYTLNASERSQLRELATSPNAYEIWKKHNLDLVDVLKAFTSIRVDSANLVNMMKTLQPRYYSIASYMGYTNLTSPTTNDLILDLIVTVVEYTTYGNQPIKKKGFCSSFLADVDIGSPIHLFIKSSGFHLPGTKIDPMQRRTSVLEKLGKTTCTIGKEPILLIAAGSGIAPFRGFYQQLLLNSIEAQHHKDIVNAIEESDYNDASSVLALQKLILELVSQCENGMCSKRSIKLFYGCHSMESNLLYKETELYSAVLNRFDAFSRDCHEPKQYNYHIMEKQSELVYSSLVKRCGYIYVCGKITMADSVYKSFCSIISKHLDKDNKIDENKRHNLFSEQIAEDFINSLKDNGRYDEDIFGN